MLQLKLVAPSEFETKKHARNDTSDYDFVSQQGFMMNNTYCYHLFSERYQMFSFYEVVIFFEGVSWNCLVAEEPQKITDMSEERRKLSHSRLLVAFFRQF